MPAAYGVAMARNPGWPCAVLLVAGVLALMLGGLALYARHAVLDDERVRDRATETLAQDEVRRRDRARIADREIEANPGSPRAARRSRPPSATSWAARPSRASSAPARWRCTTALFGDGGIALARRRWRRSASGTALLLPGAGRDLAAAVAARSPAAAMLPPADPVLFSLGGGAARDPCARPRRAGARALGARADRVRRRAAAAPRRGLRAPTLRLGLRRVALGIALACGATVAATSIGRAVVLSTFDTSHGDAVVGTIWSAFLADLRLWALALGALGVIAAAAFEPGRAGGLAARARPR